MSRLNYLLSLTPRESFRILRRRLPILRNGAAWTAEELLSSAKHGRGIRFAELLLRQEAIVQRLMNWPPLEFEGKDVVEIGCGPLGGFGPLVLFCGASSFQSAEPEWDPRLFASEEIVDRYLRVFHADLAALYGPRLDFTSFRRALADRMIVHREGFDVAPIAGPVDVVLSQSCLEHVFPLEKTIEKLKAIQDSQTRYLHLVDFGNHYPTVNPFDGLYEQPPADYLARRGKAINLQRVSDVEALFVKNAIPAHIIITRTAGDNYRGRIHSSWRDRYTDEALFAALALIVSPPS